VRFLKGAFLTVVGWLPTNEAKSPPACSCHATQRNVLNEGNACGSSGIISLVLASTGLPAMA
jgi:hypothetical protein